MLPELEALMILQDRDRKLMDLQRDLDRIPLEEERANTQLEGDRNRVEQAINALRQCEMAIQKIELDAETRRITIQRLQQQQFETRKNEEYQALAHEIDRYSKDVDSLETRELESMEELDRCREQLAEANQALAKTQALVDEELTELTTRRGNLETQTADLLTERTTLAAAVPEEALSLYQRLLKSKGDSALAAVTGAGQCSGCHMKLVPATLLRVQTGKELVQCENCARILHQEA